MIHIKRKAKNVFEKGIFKACYTVIYLILKNLRMAELAFILSLKEAVRLAFNY